MAGQGAHARRWATLCEVGPISALLRKCAGQVDSDTHKILDERAIETRRLAGQLNSSSAAHTGSDHKRRDENRGQQPTTNKQDKNCRLRDLPEIVHSASFNGTLLCSPRCRQRAHRRAGLSSLGELRNAKASSKRDVRPTRGPCGSGVGLCTLHPSPKTASQQPEPVSGSVARSFTPRLMADQHWPGMRRIVFQNGRLSDMLNITRAKEAMKRAQRSSRRVYR